ncbi:MAG: hypothetical protein A2297_03845 [Elusimicrobia bacterium RIFOXYB2_FULL_48_7]|nr:MAG: hypothetical protein A2297_03845 [Elusimicrobia bacterium RIFOXYB2_FULL_48_7]
MKNRILLIEDEENITNLLKINLSGSGFTVECACDGEQGLKKAGSFHPDLIILDIRMPKMNGWEVFDRIKAVPEYKDIKIIILTASDQKNNREKAASMNVDGFYSKPVELESLIDHITNLLN